MSLDYAVPSPEKSYPRLRIDLSQFKDIFGDVDDNVSFYVQGRICARTHTDYCKDVEVEIRKITQEGTDGVGKIALVNAADQEMEKLKRRSL